MCQKLKPFRDLVFNFIITVIGDPLAARRTEAIIFNMWTRNDLASESRIIPWDAGVGEAVVFGVGVGPLGTHSASQLGRRPRMCGVVKCLVMLLMLRWVRLVMPSSGVWVVHPFGLGKVWVTEPPRRMSMAFGWASSSSSVGMVRQTAACDGFVG